MKDGFHLCAIYEDTKLKRFSDGPKVAQPAQVVEAGPGSPDRGPAPLHPASLLSACHQLREKFLIVAAMSSCFLLPCVSAC